MEASCKPGQGGATDERQDRDGAHTLRSMLSRYPDAILEASTGTTTARRLTPRAGTRTRRASRPAALTLATVTPPYTAPLESDASGTGAFDVLLFERLTWLPSNVTNASSEPSGWRSAAPSAWLQALPRR